MDRTTRVFFLQNSFFAVLFCFCLLGERQERRANECCGEAAARAPFPPRRLWWGQEARRVLWLARFAAAHKGRMSCSFQLCSKVENVRGCFLLVAPTGKPRTGFFYTRNTYSGRGPWEFQMDFKLRLNHRNQMTWSTEDNCSSISSL